MDGAWKSAGHFPQDVPEGTPYKGKQSKASYRSEEELRDCAYDLLLEGGTRHQIIRRIHQEHYENSWSECEKAYYDAAAFLKQEQIETREILLDVLQANRLSGIQKALRRGQMMAAAAPMRDAGSVIGEAEREQQSTAVELKLTVGPPPESLPGPSQAEPIDVTPTEEEPRRKQLEMFDED